MLAKRGNVVEHHGETMAWEGDYRRSGKASCELMGLAVCGLPLSRVERSRAAVALV